MSETMLPHQHGKRHVEEYMCGKLNHTENFQIVANLFKLLDDPSRVRIFWILCHCEECVINLSAMVNMTSPAVSHHLRQLKSGGLISSRRDGKEVYYKAADTDQSRLLHQTIEGTMEISCPELETTGHICGEAHNGLTQYTQEQLETVRKLHEYVLQHLDQRITIDELAKRFLMNPTTLKAIFKEIYSKSLASHIKEHRMERAAELLRDTTDSVLQISKSVGFGSQSKFSAAFKETYQMLPLEYRKLSVKK
ncbi:MAG TPA: AraC family transcriptional regulator [Bacteroides graminisolvens]|jgi:AraC-like DNA-binding protein|uniref:AraC family transcriptional regulator n=1 Tax=Bacteroides graminisolvens TaxID=477666 RepID=A0A3D2SCT1_9BACE|nr:AraC family transcriptional regulator [Bacteroides graminisolvens]